jgi:hypothetical protein
VAALSYHLRCTLLLLLLHVAVRNPAAPVSPVHLALLQCILQRLVLVLLPALQTLLLCLPPLWLSQQPAAAAAVYNVPPHRH